MNRSIQYNYMAFQDDSVRVRMLTTEAGLVLMLSLILIGILGSILAAFLILLVRRG